MIGVSKVFPLLRPTVRTIEKCSLPWRAMRPVSRFRLCLIVNSQPLRSFDPRPMRAACHTASVPDQTPDPRPESRSHELTTQGVGRGVVVAPANRHDSPLLRRTLETLRRFDDLPDQITGQLDAG